MIAIKQVTAYPLPNVADPSLERAFRYVLANQPTVHKRHWKNRALCVFRAFLDVSNKKLKFVYLEKELSEIILPFYGFCYTEIKYSKKSMSNLFAYFEEFISDVLSETGSSYSLLKICKVDIPTAIDSYKSMKIDKQRLAFYDGWETYSRDGHPIFWHLYGFYNAYGPELTQQLWVNIKLLCNNGRRKTTEGISQYLRAIISYIIELCPTLSDFYSAGEAQNINNFIENLYCIRLIDVKKKGLSVKAFHDAWIKWINIIQFYIIKPGLWSEPPYELFNPPYRASSTNASTHIRVTEEGNAFNNKLITHVPLSYSDDAAIRTLLDNIQNDIDHVVSACNKLADATIIRARNRRLLASEGTAKFFVRKARHPRKNDPNYVDLNEPKNLCATWEHYGYNFPGEDFILFLKIQNAKQFATEYGILDNATLYPFLYLLVNEHPIITESWLLEFKLFDRHGKQVGFRKSGSVWIATSVKPRKGYKKAQQTVILNDVSKTIIENIIELTTTEREWLRSQDNDDWRYLLLTKSKPFSKPCRLKYLYSLNSRSFINSELRTILAAPEGLTTSEKALSICKNLSLTTFRASCGVRTYLKTLSVKAMSDALGHEKYNPKLLSHYLPQPILRFFQDRWIRIFQNAIIYESMKDSDHLFEAIDLNADELDRFLRNHRLKPLPEHLIKGQIADIPEHRSTNNEMLDCNVVIPVSVPILRILNAIVDLVDSANDSFINPLASQWYQTAKFVSATIDTDCNCSKASLAMREARANPIPLERLKRAVYEKH